VTDHKGQIATVRIVLSDLLTDIDGNTYAIVKIGEQLWMRENLRVTHTPDGMPITGYSYGNNENNVDIYGRLYTWDVAMNGSAVEKPRGILNNEKVFVFIFLLI
jgi:uncharacterized protein (TIGR02145 family)